MQALADARKHVAEVTEERHAKRQKMSSGGLGEKTVEAILTRAIECGGGQPNSMEELWEVWDQLTPQQQTAAQSPGK
eukprot:1097329-Amphidinium_carterae.1